MIEIIIDWKPFIMSEMPKDWMDIVLLINPSLESDNCLKLATDFWTGAKTESFKEERIAFWVPAEEVIIRKNMEKAHDS